MANFPRTATAPTASKLTFLLFKVSLALSLTIIEPLAFTKPESQFFLAREVCFEDLFADLLLVKIVYFLLPEINFFKASCSIPLVIIVEQFEEIATLPANGLSAWLNASTQRSKGEFAMVLHALAQHTDRMAEAERVLDMLLAELPVKTAVKLAADISGAPRNALYALALQKKPSADGN